MAYATVDAMAQYSAEVNARFEVLSGQVQNALTNAVNMIDTKIGEKFTIAEAAFAEERARVEARISAMTSDLSSATSSLQGMTSTQVQALAEQVNGINARESTFKDLLTDIHVRNAKEWEAKHLELQKNIETTKEAMNKLVGETKFMKDRMGQMGQAQMGQASSSGGGAAEFHDMSGKSRRAQKIKIPNQRDWAIETLKDKATAGAKDQGYAAWRENFERQIGGVWMGLDKVLVRIRDEKVTVDKETFEKYIGDEDVLSGDFEYHPDDWAYSFLSKKISLLMYQFLDINLHKTLAEARSGCGFKMYRLIDKQLDPQSDDLEGTMQQSVMAAAMVKCKTLNEEVSAVKEVQARIREWKRRCGITDSLLSSDSEKRIAHDAQVKVYATMVYANILTENTKRYIGLTEKGKQARTDIEMARECVEDLIKLEVGSRPVKMDLSAMIRPDDDQRWTETEWNEYDNEWYGDWPESPTEEKEFTENPSLDAFNQKGKGKDGKGGKSKGKGKGWNSWNSWNNWGNNSKGKGKDGKGGKGKDGKGWNNWQVGGKGSGTAPNPTSGTWVERRKCNICDVVGHIARDCPEKARLKTLVNTSVPGAQPPPASMATGKPSFCMLYARPRLTACENPKACGQSCGNVMRTVDSAKVVVKTELPAVLHNRYQALKDATAANEDDDAADDPSAQESDRAEVGLPPPSSTKSKKKRGRMQRLRRLPQREKRIRFKADAQIAKDESVVEEGVHGNGSDVDCIEATVIRGDNTSQPEFVVQTPPVQERASWADESEASDSVDNSQEARLGLVEGCSQPLMMAAGEGINQDDARSNTEPKPTVSGCHSELEKIALENFTKFRAEHGFKSNCTIDDVRNSSAGVATWAKGIKDHVTEFEGSDTIMKVGRGYASAGLCGLWARQALMAASAMPQWERVVLTVDSGASDTVIPPHIARNLPLLHSNKVGIEYEVANGGVVINLGEKRAEMKLKEDDTSSMIMSFQVVEVHKPLLAVSRLVEAGHDVRFNEKDPHILLSTGTKVPMKNNMGTYEVEVWIYNPGFAGPR